MKSRIDVGLVQRLFVDVDGAVANFHDIAGHADDALDVGLRRIQRIPEHDDVLAADLLDSIDELVDENPFLIPSSGSMLVPSTFTG